MPAFAFSQGIRINGTVFDNVGPLAGVAILVKGTTQGIASNDNGEFSITVPSESDTLLFTYAGYKTEEAGIGSRRVFAILMTEEATVLEDVTVVAFGTQKKESVIGSITTVKPGELKVPSSNLTTAFAGRVAGLISYQQSGEPGQDNANFFIRGITSFGAESKKDPLILIDGVELSTDDLARLNTDDIKSFSIMKDATSTALYGARGANGVILVTTKEGVEGKATVNIRLENSFSSPTKKVQIADPVTFMRMHNESVKTRDPMGLALYEPEKIIMTERGLYPDIYPATDWYDAMFNDVTLNQRANMSVSGGGAIARYYVAANITNDNGNLKIDKRNNFNSNISLQKYNIRSNTNVNLTKTTELILRVNASFDEYIGPLDGGSDMYRKVMQTNPVMFKPYYEPDEQFSYAKHILFGNYGNAAYLNPYASSLRGYKDYSKSTIVTQFEIKQKLDMITEGLNARVMMDIDRYSEYNVTRQYIPFYYNVLSFNLLKNTYKLRRLNTNGDETINYMPGQRFVNSTFYLEAVTEYNKLFAEKHTVNAMLVYIMRNKKVGISEDLQRSLPKRNVGLSGRLAYNYDSRYFAEFTFGYNGSERFSENNRWGFFPSVGAAWMLSNEKFFESLKSVISVLKLKGTYGLVGNDAIGSDADRFYYLADVDLYSTNAAAWGTQLSYTPLGINVKRYANDKIGWEVSYKTNLGFELELVNGLTANIEVFKERRENILLIRIIPATMGVIPEVRANLGTGSGKGFDAEVNYAKSLNKDLWLQGRATFTYATSEVIEWEEPDYSATPWKSRVGRNISQEEGYIAERLFVDDVEVQNSPTQFGNYMAGDIKYRDVNRDGKISTLDKVPIGHPTTPEINYGFGFSVGYKGFDVSCFFQGSARQSFWFDLEGNDRIQPFLDSSYEDPGNDGWIGQNSILQVFADSYWSESNRDPYAIWPRLANYEVENNSQRSTWFMQDASFMRLKEVEIGYELPSKWMDRVFLSKCRLYVSGTNLLLFSGFKLWDAEMAGNGLGYPLQRVYNIGLTLGF
jgi:TonB-linked SusC/RagA family outer membrane protein